MTNMNFYSPAALARAVQEKDGNYIAMLREEAKKHRLRAKAAEAEVDRLKNEIARLLEKGGAK